jgi:3-keto-disaccharide hydrolase/F5/8 type C domain-containing protein
VWPSVFVGVLMLGLLAAWIGGVLRVKTQDGVIVLENVPENALIEVDGARITVTTAVGKPITIEEKPGRHAVTVKRGGLVLLGESVTLESGKRLKLTVTYEASAEPKPSTTLPPSPAAESSPGTRAALAVRGDRPVKRPAVEPRVKPAVDSLQLGSVWVAEPGNWTFTVLERQGERFKAKFVAANWSREVNGTIKGAHLKWLARDVKVIAGGPGADNEGEITGDEIAMTFSSPIRTGSCSFKLRLKKTGQSDRPAGSTGGATPGAVADAEKALGRKPPVPAPRESTVVVESPRKNVEMKSSANNRKEAGGTSAAPRPIENLAFNPGDRPFPRISASFTCRFDKAERANDGKTVFAERPSNRWTSFESPNASDWLEIDFGVPKDISRIELAIYDDRRGVRVPSDYRAEVWENGAWIAVKSPKKSPLQPVGGQYNQIQFDRSRTSKVRIVFIHRGRARSGVSEILVWPDASPFVSGSAGTPSVEKPKERSSDDFGASAFVPLFNGKDTSGWRLVGNDKHSWKVLPGGVLEGSGPPTASTLTTDFADFANFHLRVETKIAEGPNSGIAFRITERNGASAQYVTFIAGTDPGEFNTGDLRISEMPGILAKADPVVPIKPGEWFTEEVIADGDVITVIAQGVEVVKFKLSHRKMMSGAIGLICRGNSKVVFRKIELRKLKGAGAGGSPSNGVISGKVPELVDWSRTAKIRGKGNWQIEGDELVQTLLEGNGSLSFGDPTWTDYAFSADVKIVQSTDNVGLIFRDGGEQTPASYAYRGGLRGVYGGAIAFSSTGNIPARRNGNTTLTRGLWHKMRINVQGNHLTAYLDDRVVMTTTDNSKTRGSVGFSTVNSICRFRDVKVTAPNGKTLWDKLPEIPTASSFGVSLRGGSQ